MCVVRAERWRQHAFVHVHAHVHVCRFPLVLVDRAVMLGLVSDASLLADSLTVPAPEYLKRWRDMGAQVSVPPPPHRALPATVPSPHTLGKSFVPDTLLTRGPANAPQHPRTPSHPAPQSQLP